MERKLKALSIVTLAFFLASCDPATSESINSSSKQSEDSSSEDNVVTIYSINDFHGAIVQNHDNYEMGLLDIGTYLKREGEKPNTLLINSGDCFQGSLESNYNRGKFLTDAMDIIKFDTFAIGNHEFDWGISTLKGLHDRHEYEYKTPWLSANIYKWDSAEGKASNEKLTDIGESYYTTTLENGLKVGIIGTIGSSQWTGINSNNVGDVTFIDPIPVIKSISDTLKTTEGCDLVFLSHHGSQNELLGQGITSVSNVSHEKYVDSVFCAHTHTEETATENGVIFTQNSGYGKNVSKITLKIDSNKNITEAKRNVLAWGNIVNSIKSNYDPELKTLYDTYTAVTNPIGSEVLATINGYLGYEFSNLVADAILNTAIQEGHNPILAMTNNPRSGANSGDFTYADLLKSLPFENTVVIMKAKGSEIKNEVSYDAQYIAINPNFKEKIQDNQMYEIACIDYLAYHMNTRHQYNYFPSIQVIADIKKNGESYIYRDMAADYLKSKGVISASAYRSSNDKFNKSNV